MPEHPFIIAVDTITPRGLVIDQVLPAAWLDDLVPSPTGLSAKKDGHVHLTLHREGDRVDVKGEATMEPTGECMSCLDPVAPKIEAHILQALFPVDPDAEKAAVEEDESAEKDASAEDDGSGEYDGKQIDWGDIVREQLILALPIAPRCKEDCQGLCAQCGINKNHESCDCAAKQIDPRWEKLRLIKPAGNN
jgi:uncharacterized protein